MNYIWIFIWVKIWIIFDFLMLNIMFVYQLEYQLPKNVLILKWILSVTLSKPIPFYSHTPSVLILVWCLKSSFAFLCSPLWWFNLNGFVGCDPHKSLVLSGDAYLPQHTFRWDTQLNVTLLFSLFLSLCLFSCS